MSISETADVGSLDVKLSLEENGIDFFNRGLDEIFGDDYYPYFSEKPVYETGNLKYGVLHLFSGFLLLLKYKVSLFDPELLFNATPIEKLRRSNELTPKRFGHKTIDFQEILSALKLGPKFQFDGAEKSAVETMQGYRNSFEHYQIDINKEILYNDLVKFLIVVDKFLDGEIKNHDHASDDILKLASKITRITEVWAAKKDRVRAEEESRLEKASKLFWSRPEYKLTPEELDEAAAQGYEEGCERAIRYKTIGCPECGHSTLISEGELAGICVNESCYSILYSSRKKKPEELTVDDRFHSVSTITSCEICCTTIAGFYMDDWNRCEICSIAGTD